MALRECALETAYFLHVRIQLRLCNGYVFVNIANARTYANEAAEQKEGSSSKQFDACMLKTTPAQIEVDAYTTPYR